MTSLTPVSAFTLFRVFLFHRVLITLVAVAVVVFVVVYVALSRSPTRAFLCLVPFHYSSAFWAQQPPLSQLSSLRHRCFRFFVKILYLHQFFTFCATSSVCSFLHYCTSAPSAAAAVPLHCLLSSLLQRRVIVVNAVGGEAKGPSGGPAAHQSPQQMPAGISQQTTGTLSGSISQPQPALSPASLRSNSKC